MSSTNKGNYKFCLNCKYKLNKGKYPCSKSHRAVRGDIKYERDFTECLLKEEN
jgi:hypothetical protein